jgi:hypothetical protein
MNEFRIVFFAAALALLGATGAAAQPIAPEMTFECTPTGVAAFRGRVHIQCKREVRCISPGALCVPRYNPVDPAIQFYATENVSSPNNLAATALAIAGQAMATNRGLMIHYRSATTENPAGCLPGDCRRFVGVRSIP